MPYKAPRASRVAQWSKALRSTSCATRDPGSSPGSVAAGRDWETHGAAYNWPSIIRFSGGFGPAGVFLSPHALVPPMAGQAQCTQQCTLTRSTPLNLEARFQVKRAWCHEAVWLGLAGLCFGGLSPLPSCSNGTIGYH